MTRITLIILCGLIPAAVAQDALSERFVAWLEEQGPDYAIIAAQTRAMPPEPRLVEDALRRAYPDFDAGLTAYENGADAEAHALFSSLIADENPFLAAHAAYFSVRTLTSRGMFEEAQAAAEALPPVIDLDRYSPYAAHLRLLSAASAARSLRFDEAGERLAQIGRANEPVEAAARQLQLEIERRETGTLAEVAGVMDYVRERLDVADSGERVRDQQDEIIALLDKLIEEQQQQEQAGGGGGRGGRAGRGKQQPAEGRGGAAAGGDAREQSDAPAGSGRIGDLHTAPRINPGDIWGKMPPAERERILQAIRERYPSRYRQIVEQYYRSLAEEN